MRHLLRSTPDCLLALCVLSSTTCAHQTCLMGTARGICSGTVVLLITLLLLVLPDAQSFVHLVSQPTSPNTAGRRSICPRPSAADSESGNDTCPRLTQHPGPPPLSVPVFSLATVNEDGSTNMNIVTYASPVGIRPDPLWMVSLYKILPNNDAVGGIPTRDICGGHTLTMVPTSQTTVESTLTYENFEREGWGVLQLLRRKHAPLVPVLGQNSGKDIDKADECAGIAFPWHQNVWQEVLSVPRSVMVVPQCITYITLHMVRKQAAGDHDAIICRIGDVAGPEEEQKISTSSELQMLETRHLREAGII